MNDIHSCSLYCERPACVLRQRDELRERLDEAIKVVAKLEELDFLYPATNATEVYLKTALRRLAAAVEGGE
jgi:chaperonin GroEL (HSP60 family)